MSGGSAQTLLLAVLAAETAIPGETVAPGSETQILNPHSDLVFRATGAESCRDCHRIGASGRLSSRTIDNDVVRNLREKAKGIHGPGRFADCLRCHAGGRVGVEKY
jgi:hypothetical protein